MSAINEARSRYRDDGEELEPILTGTDDDPDDFSALSTDQVLSMADKVFSIGHGRKKQLDAVLDQSRDGTYRIPHSHKSQYADFSDIANWEYLNNKYPWLHNTTDYIGIDDDEAEKSHGTLETFMASVPHEDWQAFITDLNGLDDYPMLDEDRTSELEIAEQDRWMAEDGGPDLIKAMVETRADSYEGYLLSKTTPDLIWEWAREEEHYPEGDGQGGVYMDMEELGKQTDTQDWFLEHIDDDVEGWVAIKRGVYDEVISYAESGLMHKTVVDAFDQMLKLMAQEHEHVAHVYNRVDASILWQMFLQAFPDEHRQDGDPYWHIWNERYDTPKLWKVGYILENGGHWSKGYKEALNYLQHAPWFIKMIGGWMDRPPEGQNELPFESLVREALEAQPDPDDAATFVRHGGGLREDVVYEDANIYVVYPRDVETLNHHLRKLGFPEVTPEHFKINWKGNDKDVFIIFGKENDDLLGHANKREIGVLTGDYDKLLGYNGSYLPQILQELRTHPQYGHSINRMLLRYYRDQAKHNSSYAPVLMQLGGVAELRRLARFGDFDLNTYAIPIGLHYVERHKYRLAAKAFNRPPETMDASGVWLIYDHVTDLIDVFKNEDGARAVFDHETHDWFGHYYEDQNLPAVDDVTPFLSPDAIKHIRKVLVNRRVWFPDGGPDGEGEYVLLTPKLLAGYDDETILTWLEKPSEQDKDDGVFDDIFDAIKLAGSDILSAAAADSVYSGYEKAAVKAIDGIQHKWGVSKTKATKGGQMDTFEVYVRWPNVRQWSVDYQENNGGPFEGSLEDLAIEANRSTIDPDPNNMEPSWRDVKKEWAAEQLDRIFQLEVPDLEPLPEPRGQATLPLGENDAEEEARAAELMKQYGVDKPDYDLAAAEKKSDDAGQTMAHKRKVATSFLKKHKYGESVDDPNAMTDMLSGIPVEFEQQVKAILKDSSEKHGYQVSDLTFKFEAAVQYSPEEIEASDGRLFNSHGPHQLLKVSYLTDHSPKYVWFYEVYRNVRAAAINTFKDYNVFDGQTLNPIAYGLPENMTTFQFMMNWNPERNVPTPPEDLPF